jgi:HD-GYP domain-containing protein (c-di-GMP phosphodiesterase class II)
MNRVLVAGALTAVLAAAVGLLRPSLLTALDWRTYDVLMRWSLAPSPPTSRVVIVDIDEASLAAIGQWPWRRDLLARFVRQIRSAGASAIAFDVVFAEPDAHPPAEGPDELFAGALREGRVALGYAFTFGGPMPPSMSCPAHPLGLTTVHVGGERARFAPFRATGAVCNLPDLAAAALTTGFLNASPDSDGILRRVPLLIEFRNRVYPSLALAAVMLAEETRDVVLRVDVGHTAELWLDGRRVPLDSKGNVLLRYRGPTRTITHVRAADVLPERFATDAFFGKIAIVGATAVGARVSVTTPTDRLFSGVEVQATAADNLLSGDVIVRPVGASTLESVATLALGIAIVFVVVRIGTLWGGVVTGLGVIGVWIGAARLLVNRHLFFSPVAPTLGSVAEFGAIAVALVFWERRRANRATTKLAESRRLMVQSLLSLTEIRDVATGLHSRRTQQYTRLLAERLATHVRFRAFMTPARIELLASLAPLHDIGKVGVPDRLLNKAGKLTLDEFEEMQRHPFYGRAVIDKAEQHVGVHDDDVLEMAKEIVYTHHERWDGHGYPRGLSGEHIPIPGRVVTVVDVYDALTTTRAYRESLSHDAAVGMIVSGRGTHFDPAVVDAFLDVAPVFQQIGCRAAA